jgi:CRP/FNR family transcriptional regulator
VTLTSVDERLEVLRRSVFAVLPETELCRLAEEVGETRLLAGNLLYDPEVAIVAAGLIRVFIADGTGRQITVSYLTAGNAIALAHLAGRRYPTAFQAVVDSVLVVVGDDRVLGLQRSNAALGWETARECSARLDDIEAELARIAFGSLRQRLAYHLLAISTARDNADSAVHLNELVIAVGSSREVISRTLGPLATEGIVHVGSGGVTIADYGRLRRLAHLD